MVQLTKKEADNNRPVYLGNLMKETGMTLRQIEDYAGVPKSTVHHDIVVKLPKIDEVLGEEARAVLLRHKRRLSIVRPLKLFMVEVTVNGDDGALCVAADDLQSALTAIKSSKMKIRRDKIIVEMPVCENLRVDSHGSFFCGDGDENGPTRCPLGSDELKPDHCPDVCKNFWSLISKKENREIIVFPGAMRVKKLLPKLTDTTGSP